MKVEGRPFRSFDVFVYMICSTIGVGLALLPFVSGEEIRSAWLKIATSSIPYFFLIYLIYLFSKKYSDWDFFSSLKKNMWAPFYYLSTLYILSTIIFGWVVILRITVVIIQSYLLANTAQWIIICVLLLSTLPAAFYGIKAISRFLVSFIFVEISILVALISVFIMSDYFRWIYIPPLSVGTDLITYLRASVSDMARFSGVFAVVAFLPFVKKDEPILTPMNFGLLFVTVIFILLSLAVVGTFGYEEALNLFSPIITLSHTFAAQYGVFERIDLLLLSFWIYIIYKMMIIHYWFIIYVTKVSLPKVKVNRIIISSVILILALTIFLPDYTHSMWEYHNHNALIALMFLPIILLIFLLFMKKGGNTNEQQSHKG